MTADNLVLERRSQDNETTSLAGGSVMISPFVEEDYWSYRVRLSETQAVLGFPKFSTVGIGFAREDWDWNTNLPYTVEAEKIFDHIRQNKGDDSISDCDVLEAIALIQQAATEDRSTHE